MEKLSDLAAIVIPVVFFCAMYWSAMRLRLRRIRKSVERFPLAKIASACGHVAVEGRVAAKKTIRTPVRQWRCVAYRCQIWWHAPGADDPELLADVTRAVPFLLRDNSGWALVRPKTARLMAAWESRSLVPFSLMPQVARFFRCADADVRDRIPSYARSALRADFDNRDGQLAFREVWIADGDEVVVLGKSCQVRDARVAELGTPKSYRSAPEVTKVGPAPDEDGVWMTAGTHAELMAELQSGSRLVRDLGGL